MTKKKNEAHPVSDNYRTSQLIGLNETTTTMKKTNNNNKLTMTIGGGGVPFWVQLPLLLLLLLQLTTTTTCAKEYYYTRTRTNPQHLRIAETLKNQYTNDIKYKSKINGTNYEYYASSLAMSHDELVFEVIDKMFRHRLSPFYIHHYDNEEDKKLSSDSSIVSHEACARDLLYLLDNIPKRTSKNSADDSSTTIDKFDEQENTISPELDALYDSYAKQESGLLMGNTYWIGAYDQCVNRHIFELTKSTPQSSSSGGGGGNERQQSTPTGESDPRVVSFNGRYCVASLKSPLWDRMIESRKKSDRHYFKSKRQVDSYAQLFRLQIGICLPSSCDSQAIERHHDEIKLLTTAQLESRYTDYDLIDLYCIPDESSPLRRLSGSAIGFIMFMSIWLTGIFIATVADMFDFVDASEALNPSHGPHNKPLKRSTAQKLVTWFSLRSNYRKFMHVKCDEDNNDNVEKKTKKSYKKKTCDEDSNIKVGTNKSDKDDGGKREQLAAPADAEPEEKIDSNDKLEKVSEDRREKQVFQSETIKINLRFLNAFKVMIMFWIVNGHIMLLMIQTAKNILYSDALLNSLMHFLIGATFGVDLFFTMTGFLAAYLIFNSGHANRMKPLTWLYMFFHRYWRLAPMYLLTFWFSKSVMQLLGSGPLWDYGTSSITFRGLCNQESWWYPMTLTSNLHGLFEECMIQSWYISCDMQFWLASPLFIYLLAKRPSYGWAASLAAIFVSSKKRFDIILADKSARYDELVKPRADIFMRVSHDLPALYTHPQYRIGAYIVGMLAGHYVYMVKSGRWRTSMLPAVVSIAGAQADTSGQLEASTVEGKGDSARSYWSKANITMSHGLKRSVLAYLGATLVLVMSFVSYLLSHYYPHSHIKHARMVAAYAYAVDHLLMSGGFSLVMITMCLGQWPRLVSFLSHPNWTRLSKINYAILLLQCEAIYYQIFRYDQVPVAGTKELTNILFNLLVTLYPIAFAVTLVFEFPLANIEKLLV